MLIGIYGPHAVGKTTFLQQNLDRLGDYATQPLRVVCADNPAEYHLSDDGQTWAEYRRIAWKRDRPAKLPLMKTAIQDDAVWIVESARFFSGFGPELLEFRRAGGELKFIIPVVHPNLMRQFIIERCEHNGKPFNEPYWDEARLRYECHDRYVNFINTHMRPAGVEYYIVEVDAIRTAWNHIFELIRRWL